MARNKKDIAQSLDVLVDYKKGLLTNEQAVRKLQEFTGLSFGVARSFIQSIKKKEINNENNVVPFPIINHEEQT
jgi:hypothetical protein|tara:strand:+ start:978 stop:1199 length:222 start_codon:yes stop_codon:yes gene_type:complete